MPFWSQSSKTKLATADDRLQVLFNSMIITFDCKILYGHRDPAEQFELFKRGRRLESGLWVIENPKEIVTYKDGYDNLSKHNFLPSLAIDVVPWPIDWHDTERMSYFAGMVMERARSMGIPVRWGADWDNDTILKEHKFVDRPHFELIA